MNKKILHKMIAVGLSTGIIFNTLSNNNHKTFLEVQALGNVKIETFDNVLLKIKTKETTNSELKQKIDNFLFFPDRKNYLQNFFEDFKKLMTLDNVSSVKEQLDLKNFGKSNILDLKKEDVGGILENNCTMFDDENENACAEIFKKFYSITKKGEITDFLSRFNLLLTKIISNVSELVHPELEESNIIDLKNKFQNSSNKKLRDFANNPEFLKHIKFCISKIHYVAKNSQKTIEEIKKEFSLLGINLDEFSFNSQYNEQTSEEIVAPFYNIVKKNVTTNSKCSDIINAWKDNENLKFAEAVLFLVEYSEKVAAEDVSPQFILQDAISSQNINENVLLNTLKDIYENVFKKFSKEEKEAKKSIKSLSKSLCKYFNERNNNNPLIKKSSIGRCISSIFDGKQDLLQQEDLEELNKLNEQLITRILRSNKHQDKDFKEKAKIILFRSAISKQRCNDGTLKIRQTKLPENTVLYRGMKLNKKDAFAIMSERGMLPSHNQHISHTFDPGIAKSYSGDCIIFLIDTKKAYNFYDSYVSASAIIEKFEVGKPYIDPSEIIGFLELKANISTFYKNEKYKGEKLSCLKNEKIYWSNELFHNLRSENNKPLNKFFKEHKHFISEIVEKFEKISFKEDDYEKIINLGFEPFYIFSLKHKFSREKLNRIDTDEIDLNSDPRPFTEILGDVYKARQFFEAKKS